MWKGNECAAGKNFSNLAFQTAHGCQMRQPPLRNISPPPSNRPTTPPPLKMKIFWHPPKIKNFQISTPPLTLVRGAHYDITNKEQKSNVKGHN